MSTKDARLEVRMPQEKKEMLERAVQLTGRTMADFVRDSVEKEARKTLKDYEVMELSKRDSKVFAEALINPSEPSDQLKEAAKRYKENTAQ